jgi:hypothetical protein
MHSAPDLHPEMRGQGSDPLRKLFQEGLSNEIQHSTMTDL